MLDYKTLDWLANAFVPFLVMVFFLLTTIIFFKIPSDRKALAKIYMYTTALMLIAYGFLELDARFHLWHTAGLAYSAPVTLALTLTIPLCFLLGRYQIIAILSFTGYLALMRYQKYYTLPDMLTSGLIIALCAFLLYRWLFPN